MATLKKRGKYWCAIMRDPVTGKQIWRSTKAESKPVAKKVLAEWENQLYKNEYINPSKQKLEDYLKKWLDGKNLTQGTRNNYKSIMIRHLIPKLGFITLEQLKPFHVQDFYNEIKKTLPPSMIIKMHCVLNGSLNAAMRLQIIQNNPCQYIELPKVPKKEMEILSDKKEVDKLIKRIEGTGNKDLLVFVMLALYGGMRLGESSALRWKNVDLEKNQINIIEQITPLNEIRAPKRGSKRLIDIPAKLGRFLKKMKTEQNNYKMLIRDLYQDNDLVICREIGKQYGSRALARMFETFKAENPDIKKVRYHDLRHTYASWLISTGADINTVKYMLGHKSVRMTYDLYGHLLPPVQKEAMNRFEERLGLR